MEKQKRKPTLKDIIIAGTVIVVSFFAMLVGIQVVGNMVLSDTKQNAQPTVIGDIDNKVETLPYCFEEDYCLEERYYFVIRDEFYPVNKENFNKFRIGQIVSLNGSSSVTEITMISEGDDGPSE